MRTLDRIDYAIIRALQNNGRLSNKELAHVVGLAPSSCLARVRALRDDGVLGETRTEVAPGRVGVGLQAMVFVRLRLHERDAFESFRSHALAMDELVALYQLSGADDFLAHVAVRDAEHLRQLTMDGFASRPEVGHLSTSLLFGAETRTLPVYEPDDAS
ncbi:MAG: Lrp/AsnC family transcriptional regulator [Deltaproteobacteria bacterium]|nr:MAG: Lrp/AsnC family transcriptional regulator [Deltaproteobacteria bacterium]